MPSRAIRPQGGQTHWLWARAWVWPGQIQGRDARIPHQYSLSPPVGQTLLRARIRGCMRCLPPDTNSAGKENVSGLWHLHLALSARLDMCRHSQPWAEHLPVILYLGTVWKRGTSLWVTLIPTPSSLAMIEQVLEKAQNYETRAFISAWVPRSKYLLSPDMSFPIPDMRV